MDGIQLYLIEDDAAVRVSLTALLHSAGYQVHGFANAEAFLDCATKDQANCLISDLRLPVMNGLELLETLSAAQITPPVILLTGNLEIDTVATPNWPTPFTVLPKPCDPQKLLETINAFIALATPPTRTVTGELRNPSKLK